MPAPDAASDLALLTGAARAAGPVALSFWKRSPRVWDKGAEGPVSEADLAVNASLEAQLRAARPGYGWLSEEGPAVPGWQDRRSFVVDPIDGTRAFIAGETAFAVALAVVEGGRVLDAVVFLPAQGRLYAAGAGGGPATLDGAPMAASARPLDGARVLASAASLAPAHWPGGFPPVQRSLRPSLAWRFCLVAEGAFDALVTLREAWVWDVAAGALIAERAGALVSDRDGGRLDFRQTRLPGLLAAGAPAHAALVAARHRGPARAG